MRQKQQEDYQLPRLPPSKREIQYQKSLVKNLRDRGKQKKMVESEVDQDDDYYSKKSTETGQRWWRKFDRRFFKSGSEINLQKILSKLAPQNIITAFQAPPDSLGSYEDSIIAAEIPQILQQQTLRVLHSYKNEKQSGKKTCTLSLYTIEQNEDQQVSKEEQIVNFEIYPLHGKKKKRENDLEIIDEASNLKPAILQCIRTTDDQQLIEKCLNFLLVNKSLHDNIYKESLYWQKELDIQNFQNQNQIRKLLCTIQSADSQQFFSKSYLRSLITQIDFLGPNGPVEDPFTALSKQTLRQIQKIQVEQITKHLSWMNTLKYIQYGHADKNVDMMQALLGYRQNEQGIQSSIRKKSKQQKMLKAFETDCKVCFCTQNQDRNKVVYCDKCNTSFHQICYGIQTIDKDLPYYCQTCQYLIDFQSKNKQEKLKKICCQICFKFNFPLKQLNGHFYHVTCLMMFNFGQIKNYQVCLRDGLTHQNIQQTVIENEIQNQYCQFCIKSGVSSMGMRLTCMVDECKKASHPICAYLNGAMFDIKKQGCNLKVGVVCSQHVEQRDKPQQVYLRRFFCDYKGTSKYSQDDFRKKYEQQEYQRQISKLQMRSMQRPISKKNNRRFYLNPSRILQRTKVVNKKLALMSEMGKTAQILKCSKTFDKRKDMMQEIGKAEYSERSQDKQRLGQNISMNSININQIEQRTRIKQNFASNSNRIVQQVFSPQQNQMVDQFTIIKNARHHCLKKSVIKEKRKFQLKIDNAKCSKTSIEREPQKDSIKMVDQNAQQSLYQQVMHQQLQLQSRKLIKQYTNVNSSYSHSGQLHGVQSKLKIQIQPILKPRKMAKVVQDQQYVPEIKGRR